MVVTMMLVITTKVLGMITRVRLTCPLTDVGDIGGDGDRLLYDGSADVDDERMAILCFGDDEGLLCS